MQRNVCVAWNDGAPLVCRFQDALANNLEIANGGEIRVQGTLDQFPCGHLVRDAIGFARSTLLNELPPDSGYTYDGVNTIHVTFNKYSEKSSICRTLGATFPSFVFVPCFIPNLREHIQGSWPRFWVTSSAVRKPLAQCLLTSLSSAMCVAP